MLGGAILGLVLVIVALVLAYQGGRWLESQNRRPETRGDYTQRLTYENTIQRGNSTYRQRKGFTTILLMGVDHENDTQTVASNRNGGQADFLRLLVLDKEKQTVTQVQIDRDTMTPITILGVLGNKSGVRTAQICLSHGFGDGKSQSCALTAEAVSNLMLGIPIDFYMAMNLDGISTLNDMVGGVEVTLEDDFSALDATMTKGTTLTLMGDQAEYFVRSRMSIGVGTNEARMARQEFYIAKLSDILYNRISQDKNYSGIVYDQLSPYLTTNLPRGRLINEIWAAREYQQTDAVKLPGFHQIGTDGFMQFHVDEAALEAIVLDLFYEKVP